MAKHQHIPSELLTVPSVLQIADSHLASYSACIISLILLDVMSPTRFFMSLIARSVVMSFSIVVFSVPFFFYGSLQCAAQLAMTFIGSLIGLVGKFMLEYEQRRLIQKVGTINSSTMSLATIERLVSISNERDNPRNILHALRSVNLPNRHRPALSDEDMLVAFGVYAPTHSEDVSSSRDVSGSGVQQASLTEIPSKRLPPTTGGIANNIVSNKFPHPVRMLESKNVDSTTDTMSFINSTFFQTGNEGGPLEDLVNRITPVSGQHPYRSAQLAGESVVAIRPAPVIGELLDTSVCSDIPKSEIQQTLGTMKCVDDNTPDKVFGENGIPIRNHMDFANDEAPYTIKMRQLERCVGVDWSLDLLELNSTPYSGNRILMEVAMILFTPCFSTNLPCDGAAIHRLATYSVGHSNNKAATDGGTTVLQKTPIVYSDSSSRRVFWNVKSFDTRQLITTDRTTLTRFVAAIESQYNNQNPYHAPVHAAQVMHSAVCCLHQLHMSACMSIIDTAALLIACLCHDVGHPARNNAFLINTYHQLAITYNDTAVLENYHAATAFRTLNSPGNGVLDSLSASQFRSARKRILQLILATDMSTHFDTIKKAKFRRMCSDFDIHANVEDMWFHLEICIKAADLAHAGLPWRQHYQWSLRVTAEFHEQGDAEAEMGLPKSPLCDRNVSDAVPSSQISFLHFVVKPLYVQMYAPSKSLRRSNRNPRPLKKIQKNIERWRTLKDTMPAQTLPAVRSSTNPNPAVQAFPSFDPSRRRNSYMSAPAVSEQMYRSHMSERPFGLLKDPLTQLGHVDE
eukprot:Lankesteria_metandrocarpae@DN4845_c0_g2_i1.p1